MNPPGTLAPTFALAGIRALLAGLCVIVGLNWAGEQAFLAAAWYGIPAVLVALRLRWALWLTLAMNAVIVALALLVLPNFGRLHGGEMFAFAGVPAVAEIALAVYVLRRRAKPVKGSGTPDAQ